MAYRHTTGLLLPVGPFPKVTREVARERSDDILMAADAVVALQTSAEAFLVALFECKLSIFGPLLRSY